MEFERHMRIAWSCLKDVEHKIDEIRNAKQAADQQVNEGTFRGTIAMTRLQGKLESEFCEGLEMAWKSALRASVIDADGFIQVSEGAISAKTIFAAVCGLRGDVGFALENWDQAIACYSEALRHAPREPIYFYDLGAAYANKHEPQPAISAFQKVIELDPIGHHGIEAAKLLEKLKAGNLGRKAFRGSWIVLLALGAMTVFSFSFLFGHNPMAGLINVPFWGGILALYYWRKFK